MAATTPLAEGDAGTPVDVTPIPRTRSRSTTTRPGVPLTPSPLEVGSPPIASPPLFSPTDRVKSPVSSAIERHKRGSRDDAPGPRFVLGSSSWWRQQVMRELGVEFRVEKPDIDEKAITHGDRLQLPLAVARAKAAALRERIHEPAILITADQILLAPPAREADDAEGGGGGGGGGEASSSASSTSTSPSGGSATPNARAEGPAEDGLEVHEKPESLAQARAFIRGYSGGLVKTVSAVVVTNLLTGAQADGIDIATLHFRPIPEASIVAAVEPVRNATTGAEEPSPVLSCCGALCIEHPPLAPYLDRVEGSTDSVFGLPKVLLASLVAKVGGTLDLAASAPGRSFADE